MDTELIKQYIKDNLRIQLHYKGQNTIEAVLFLDGVEFSKDFIHYRVKQ